MRSDNIPPLAKRVLEDGLRPCSLKPLLGAQGLCQAGPATDEADAET